MNGTAIQKAREYIQETNPDIPIPEKSYLVLFSPRSGSTLLSNCLEKIGFGRPIEAFNSHLNFRKSLNWEIDFSDPHEYFKKAFSYQTLNGVMGMKLSFIQFKLFLENARKLLSGLTEEFDDSEIVEIFFHEVKYIFIQRRKKVKQAISLAKGIQNGIWFEEEGQDSEYKKYLLPTVYDRDQIEYCFDTSLTNDIFWQHYLRKNNLSALNIYYEDLDSNFIEQMSKVYEFLNIEDKEIIAPQLRKQSNKQSEDWESRFISQTSWFKDPEINQAYIKGDLETLYDLRCKMIISEREMARWRSMPINRYKKIRTFAFRVRRKLTSLKNQVGRDAVN